MEYHAPILTLLLLTASVYAFEEEEEQPSTPETVAGEIQEAPKEEAPASEKKQPKADGDQLHWDVEGYLQQIVRYRHVSGDDDLHLRTYLFADATRGGIRVRVNAQLIWNAISNDNPNDPLRDIWDGFSTAVQVLLYEAYVDVSRLGGGNVHLRAGRQFIDEGVYIQFDGARFDFPLDDANKYDLSIIGGVPVPWAWASTNGNWMAGAVFRARLDEKTRARISYYHISENFPGINDPNIDPINQPLTIPEQQLDDDLLGFSLWHHFRPDTRFFGRFTLLNGDPNELHLRLRYFTVDQLWTLVVEWYQLFERLTNVVNDLTPYVPLLGSYQPFYRISARVTRQLGDLWSFQAGFAHRSLENETDEGVFNREYNNYFASLTRIDAWVRGLDITVVLNGFNTRENDVVNVGGHVTWRVSPTVDLDAGIDYAFYKYILFQNTERENVYTYSVRVDWRARKKTTVTGGISIDDDRFFTYTTLFARVTVRF